MKHADGGYSIYVLLRFARVADDAGHRFILRRTCQEQKCAQHRYAQFIFNCHRFYHMDFVRLFAPGNPLIGGLDWIGLQGVGFEPNADYSETIPHTLYLSLIHI